MRGYIPQKGMNAYDTINFDKEFTKLAIDDTFVKEDDDSRIDIRYMRSH